MIDYLTNSGLGDYINEIISWIEQGTNKVLYKIIWKLYKYCLPNFEDELVPFFKNLRSTGDALVARKWPKKVKN